MSKKAKAPPIKGQRSIASFVFKKEAQTDAHDDLASGSAPAARAPPPSANTADEVINLVDEEKVPPSKRPRQEKSSNAAEKKIPAPAAAAPAKPKSTTITPPIEAEARHQRWQSKFVGDESAGMQRVRTQ